MNISGLARALQTDEAGMELLLAGRAGGYLRKYEEKIIRHAKDLGFTAANFYSEVWEDPESQEVFELIIRNAEQFLRRAQLLGLDAYDCMIKVSANSIYHLLNVREDRLESLMKVGYNRNFLYHTRAKIILAKPNSKDTFESDLFCYYVIANIREKPKKFAEIAELFGLDLFTCARNSHPAIIAYLLGDKVSISTLKELKEKSGLNADFIQGEGQLNPADMATSLLEANRRADFLRIMIQHPSSRKIARFIDFLENNEAYKNFKNHCKRLNRLFWHLKRDGLKQEAERVFSAEPEDFEEFNNALQNGEIYPDLVVREVKESDGKIIINFEVVDDKIHELIMSDLVLD